MITALIIFLMSLFLTGIYRSYAIRKSILDVPNERSSHAFSTPRGGGIAIAVAWFTGLVIFFLTNKIENRLFYALLSGAPLALIGFTDDILNLSPGIRLFVQMGCTFLGLLFLGGFDSFSIGIPGNVLYILFNILAFIAVLWTINLFNFLDGIDGYISAEIVFIGVSIWALTGDMIGLLLAAATLGFLFWNWEKAKIFMGDAGSTLLGFNVAILAIFHHNNNISSITVWLILTSVFWVDATVTLYRRIRNKEKLSVAHRKHAYQRIVQAGFSHQKTVAWAFILNVVGFGLAFLAIKFTAWQLLFLLIDLVMLFLVLRYIDKVKPFENRPLASDK